MLNLNRQRALQHPSRRRGAIAVLTAFCLVMLMAMVAFSVDIGVIMIAKTDLQRAADAAAHAAVLEFRSNDGPSVVIPRVRSTAAQYVAVNDVLNSTATVATNSNNVDPNGDIVVGRIDLANPQAAMTFGNPSEYNAVRVTVRRSVGSNGEVPLFFARIFGRQSHAVKAQATVAIVHNAGGFKIPGSGVNVPFLPITISEHYWEAGLAAGIDEWAFDSSDSSISEQSDETPEVVLFPNATESAGNFGTLNVGTSNNSAATLAGQIRNGLSQSDLDYHGGELALDTNGELILTGNPGLTASIQNDLDAIAGQPVIIPIYREVTGNGNNAEFVIVRFVGARIMAVQLTGPIKYVAVQPANVTFNGTVQSAPGVEGTSDRIYSPPVMVQ